MSVDYKALANRVIKSVEDRERKRFKNREIVLGLLGSKAVKFLSENKPLFKWFADHIAYRGCRYADNDQDCSNECNDREYIFDFRTMDFMEVFKYEGEVTDQNYYIYNSLGDNSEALHSLLAELPNWLDIYIDTNKKAD